MNSLKILLWLKENDYFSPFARFFSPQNCNLCMQFYIIEEKKYIIVNEYCTLFIYLKMKSYNRSVLTSLLITYLLTY